MSNLQLETMPEWGNHLKHAIKKSAEFNKSLTLMLNNFRDALKRIHAPRKRMPYNHRTGCDVLICTFPYRKEVDLCLSEQACYESAID